MDSLNYWYPDFSFYANWNINQKRAYKDLKEVAINLSNNIDGFIEDLLQEIYALPVYGKKLSIVNQIYIHSWNISH